jgi:hypothetical protein
MSQQPDDFAASSDGCSYINCFAITTLNGASTAVES